MEQGKQFDLTPSPRVLRMLGQVDFKPWQCLAELADNAVDAFLTGREQGGTSVMFPQVNIEVSSAADIRAGTGRISVSDNAPGMDPSMLERAVKAGYSGNNSVDKLGLFGMGFNVATARLGNRTEVWTTQPDDEHWWGVRIDFDEMEKSETFQIPALTRAKTPSERDRHGTEIVITKLDQDRAVNLRSSGGIRVTREKLSRVYNKIMRDVGLKIIVAGQELKSRDFCVWDKQRSVETPGRSGGGRVPAVFPIDVDLGERRYCTDCWVWLLQPDPVCPACGSSDQLRARSRKISGWVGIQRFFDQSDYGIDLVRNGRVIEERSKVFFSWAHPDDGTVLPEYPLEQTHWGGRIVGELNIDFVPLASHQKDSFDRNTAEWNMVMDAIHGNGPILPQIRKTIGFQDSNESPLARLHSAYRRGHPPGPRTLVPGNAKGEGINTDPQQWATKFWEGDPEYQTDELWWRAVLEGDEGYRNRRGTPIPPDQRGTDLLPISPATPNEPPDESGETPIAVVTPQAPTPPLEERDIALSKEISLPELPGSSPLNLETSRIVSGSLPSGLHMEFAAVGNRISVLYDPQHRLYTHSLTEPVDCLVEELAYQLLQRSNTNQLDWPISRIGQLLKEKHFPWSIRSYDLVREQCGSLLDELLEHFETSLSELAPLDENVVTDSEHAVISRNVARVERAGGDRVSEVIRGGLYPKFLGHDGLIGLLMSKPGLVFDDKFFGVSYKDVEEQHRPEILDQVLIPLRDAIWAASFDANSGSSEEHRIMLARADAGVRLLQSWRI